MADKDPADDGPSLELPSFGFKRKKKAAEEKAVVPEPAPEPAPEPEPEPVPQPKQEAVRQSEPANKPTPAPAPTPEPTPAKKPAKPQPKPQPAAAPTPPVTPQPQPQPKPQLTPQPEPEPEKAPTPPREKREFTFPALPALHAAVVVGAVIGLIAVLLTFASLKLCEVTRGTDSCGIGPGLLLLIATLVLLTYLGGWLLRGFGIDDAGSTSFLAVSLLAVLTMLFLLDVIYSWSMIIVVPLVAMATFALSWWVTTRFVEVSD